MRTTRAWTRRFAPRNNGRYPTALHAGAYATTLHYLKAVDALGASSDSKAVVEQMKKLPTDDPPVRQGQRARRRPQAAQHVSVRGEDARDSRYPWDYYKLVKTIAPSEAWRPLAERRLRIPQVVTDNDRPPVALVTGGGGDIGRAVALRLARMSATGRASSTAMKRPPTPRRGWSSRPSGAGHSPFPPMFRSLRIRSLSSRRPKPAWDRSASSPTMRASKGSSRLSTNIQTRHSINCTR